MDYRLPDLGEGIFEAELVEWLVRPGQTVRSGQSLAEVMTDKATIELPSPFEGTICQLHADPGQTVEIGFPLLSYTPAGAPRGGEPGAAEEPLGSVYAAVREQEAEPAREPAAGKPQEAAAESSQETAAAGVAAMHRAPASAPAPRSGRAPSGPAGKEAGVAGGTAAAAPASPAVRQMARSLGVDLAGVRGSGPGGRILFDDVAAASGRLGPTAETPRTQRPQRGRPHPPVPSGRTALTGDKDVSAAWGVAGTRMPFRGLRRRIAERMVQSKRTIPHYSYVDECEVTQLVSLREALRESFLAAGCRLTYLPFIVRAVVAALQEVPLVNSTLDEDSGEIVLHDRYHIGIATSTRRGLIVPVLRNADRLTLPAIAREIERLASGARSGRLGREDLGGGTFTVTSIGGIGGLISAPIINPPEVGILGVGRIVKRPVCDAAGAIRTADMVYLSFSFDHRVVDGAVGAAFGNALIRGLNSPAALLLAGQLAEASTAGTTDGSGGGAPSAVAGS